MSSENVLTPYEKVLAARKSDRPGIMKYIEVLFDDFIEMHGDRYYKDDKSLVAGIATGVAVYLLLCMLFRVPEIKQLKNKLFKRKYT